MNKKTNVQKLVVTGMLAALAGVLMSLEISVPMMPPFYKIDFSDVPSLIALFLMGPWYAAAVEVIKILIKLFTVGTNTMYVGEFANLIGIAIFVVPTWLIYKGFGKNLSAMVKALAITIPIRIAFSCFCNACITLPLYAKAFGMSIDEVVVTVSKVNPSIHDLATFLILATIPFNFIKILVNNVVAFILYSRLRKANVFTQVEAKKEIIEEKEAA